MKEKDLVKILGEVQHKTGANRLNIQSLASLIENKSDDEEIIEYARKIMFQMDNFTNKLHSSNYKDLVFDDALQSET